MHIVCASAGNFGQAVAYCARLPVQIALNDMQGLFDDTILVQEETIERAMKLLYNVAGLIVEPSGAVGIAAILETPKKFKNKRVATIICGSNVAEIDFERNFKG